VGSYNSISTIKEGTKLCEVVTLQFDRRRANGSRVGREWVMSGSEWVTGGSRNESPVSRVGLEIISYFVFFGFKIMSLILLYFMG
jgi:hypothetical protein